MQVAHTMAALLVHCETMSPSAALQSLHPLPEPAPPLTRAQRRRRSQPPAAAAAQSSSAAVSSATCPLQASRPLETASATPTTKADRPEASCRSGFRREAAKELQPSKHAQPRRMPSSVPVCTLWTTAYNYKQLYAHLTSGSHCSTPSADSAFCPRVSSPSSTASPGSSSSSSDCSSGGWASDCRW